MVFSRKHDPQPAKQNHSAPDAISNGSAPPVPASSKSPAMHAGSVIGNDLSIEGQTITIRCKGNLRVNGHIQADLHSKELEVGREGSITGSIAANTVNVFGRVAGAIKGSRVILHASAEVEGDIHSGDLAIESGASFDGRSRKAREGDDIRPQLDKTAPQVSAQQASAGPPQQPQPAQRPQQTQGATVASPFTVQQPNHLAS